MKNVVEQVCIVRAIKNNGSNVVLSLEPKKQKCKGCDGKCAKMLKPVEYIDIAYNKDDLEVDDEIMLYMEKNYLAKLVFQVLGLPLLALLTIVILGTALDFSESLLIASIFISLSVIFFLQVRYLKVEKQLKIRKN
ncbi:MAG TPA: hypothetical protein DCL21_04880 [Alphaproteobacteria bacterium]|nr:hypothetical protein [Alphaproteobacteria bacterium]